MVRLRNGIGLIKECPTGFSWTTLFFGIFVPLLRGWMGFAVIWLIASVCTLGIACLIFPFIINKKYIEHLMQLGFGPASQADYAVLSSIGLTIQMPPSNYTAEIADRSA